jgi:hypothetical protein
MANAQQKIYNQRDVNTRTGVLNIDAKIKRKRTKQKMSKIINPAGKMGEREREKGGKESSFLFVYMYNKYMFYVVAFFFVYTETRKFQSRDVAAIVCLCRVFISSSYNGGGGGSCGRARRLTRKKYIVAGGNVISKAKTPPSCLSVCVCVCPNKPTCLVEYVTGHTTTIVVHEKQHTLSSWKSSSPSQERQE